MPVTYAPHTQTDALKRAKNWVGKSYRPGMCQYFTVIEIFGTGGVGDWDGDRSPDAEDGWKAAVARGAVVHAKDIKDYSKIPGGLAAYWEGGSHDNGHAAPTAPGGMIISTDLPNYGRVGLVPITMPHDRWGLKFLGYVTTEGHGLRLTDKPSAVNQNTVAYRMNPDNYGPGHEGPHITWLGQQLVLHGFGRFYKTGPGPVWGPADEKNLQAFQKAQTYADGRHWTGADADGQVGTETLKRAAAAPKPAKAKAA